MARPGETQVKGRRRRTRALRRCGGLRRARRSWPARAPRPARHGASRRTPRRGRGPRRGAAPERVLHQAPIGGLAQRIDAQHRAHRVGRARVVVARRAERREVGEAVRVRALALFPGRTGPVLVSVLGIEEIAAIQRDGALDSAMASPARPAAACDRAPATRAACSSRSTHASAANRSMGPSRDRTREVGLSRPGSTARRRSLTDVFRLVAPRARLSPGQSHSMACSWWRPAAGEARGA